MKKLTGLMIYLMLSSPLGVESTKEWVTICENDEAHINCFEGESLKIRETFYGRSDTTTCNQGEEDTSKWNVACSSTSTDAVISMCSQYPSKCLVKVKPRLFDDPCPGTPKYLKVDYTCLKVKEPVYSSSEILKKKELHILTLLFVFLLK